MLRISPGYSPDYLLKEVATGRENYYTGAVAEGEPPGRWWGSGAELLGLTGLVDAQDMRGVYERFLDPRHEGFKDREQWDNVPTLGHTGRKYLSEDDLYALALEREPGASAERRAELRTEAGKTARHNLAFLDMTFSVQKSITLIHTAFEAEEVKARRAGDEDTAAAWGLFRQAVEDAIWAGNNAALAYMAEHTGYSRVGHHGGAAGRFVDAHDWVVASFFAARSPVTRTTALAYEELIEAEYLAAEQLDVRRPDLVATRPGWCEGIRATLRWAWRHSGPAPLPIPVQRAAS